jgi:AraC-like DNA-binding protein
LDRDPKLLEVQFAHEAPEQTAEHHRIFRAPVLFGCDTNALVIERSLTERHVPAADQQLYLIMKRYLDQVLSEIPKEDSLFAPVRKAIAESMRDGNPQLARVAKTLAMSPRTLQRRLKKSGLDFKKLVEDTRRRFAINISETAATRLLKLLFCSATPKSAPSTARSSAGPARLLWPIVAKPRPQSAASLNLASIDFCAVSIPVS